MDICTLYAHSPEATAAMNTAQLRRAFLAEGLFAPGKANGVYTHHDRIAAFGIVPEGDPIPLPLPDQVRADHLLQRREAGVLNVGGRGAVTADGETYALAHTSAMYLGRGTRDVTFTSEDPADPAAFYVFTAAAHAAYPSTLITGDRMNIVELGDAASGNRRTLHQCVIEGRTASANIAFGFTTVHHGSTWNTMPPHTHDRRTECYLYFDMGPADRVFHVMGEPQESRHLVVADRELVVSPSWSMHFGAGTGSYSFVWATAGENATYDDADGVPVAGIR